MASVTEKVTEKVAQAKEKAKESLVGVEIDDSFPPQTRAEFMQHAIKDDDSEEYYMGQKQFVDAIAPVGEDYVRIFFYSFIARPLHD